MPKKIEEWMDDFDAVFERKGLFYSQEEVDDIKYGNTLDKAILINNHEFCLEQLRNMIASIKESIGMYNVSEITFSEFENNIMAGLKGIDKLLSSEHQDSNLTPSITKLEGASELSKCSQSSPDNQEFLKQNSKNNSSMSGQDTKYNSQSSPTVNHSSPDDNNVGLDTLMCEKHKIPLSHSGELYYCHLCDDEITKNMLE